MKNETRCYNCKYAEYNENGNPVCTAGNNVNELNTRYFGCYHKPQENIIDKEK